MDPNHLIQQTMDQGHSALSEYDAHRILAHYEVPMLLGELVMHPQDAVQAALTVGFPVVLKASGRALTHKSEQHLVHLNLNSAAAVLAAAQAVSDGAGEVLTGMLVQPFVAGSREFVAGMFRDPQFGPVVMFGLGGIFTETLADFTLRVAPLSEKEAGTMLDEIRSRALLDALRGESAVQRPALVKTLVALSQIAMTHAAVAEIDINPLRVTPDGAVVAVDALMILRPPGTTAAPHPAVSSRAIGELFHPHSVAFVGASGQVGKWGHMLMVNTIAGGFKGDIHLVNPKAETIAGRKVYHRLEDLPDRVDLAVVTIPAAGVLDLIPQMKAKSIRYMLLITSGFGETDPAGKALEQELVARAQAAGILVLGPNTMGICNPHIGFFCTGSTVRPMPGSTAMVAQSGNMGTQLLAFAEQQGIGIRAFCGSGNEAMITIEDYLDGFQVDDLTRTVLLYVESVKDGRRFLESARAVVRKKPVVLLKGGQSSAGHRAAASHTGAMTSDSRVFDAVCRQAGIIKVDQPMELLDLAAAFSSLPLPRGNRAAIMTLGGGWGVVTADLCERYGLTIPELPEPIIARLNQILPPYWSHSNPVDLVGERDLTLPLTVMETLLKWDACDAVINLGIFGMRHLAVRLAQAVRKADPTCSEAFLNDVTRMMTDFEMQYVTRTVALMHTYQKPVYGVSLITDATDKTVQHGDQGDYRAVFYETPERAVKAFARMFQYGHFLQQADSYGTSTWAGAITRGSSPGDRVGNSKGLQRHPR